MNTPASLPSSRRSPVLNRRHTLVLGGAALLAATRAHAQASAVPPEVAAEVPGARLLGKGLLRFVPTPRFAAIAGVGELSATAANGGGDDRAREADSKLRRELCNALLEPHRSVRASTFELLARLDGNDNSANAFLFPVARRLQRVLEHTH